MWRYEGFEKELFMQPYFDSFETKGVLIGPGGAEGFAVLSEGELYGLFEFYRGSEYMNIGLALHPNNVGKGYGCMYVEQGVKFGIENFAYAKEFIELTVHKMNIPAIKVYEKVGFEVFEDEGEEFKMRKNVD